MGVLANFSYNPKEADRIRDKKVDYFTFQHLRM